MLPDFLIIGAMKCGTTSLWAHLREHPDVYLPDRKEIEFFTRRWDQGVEWYQALFEPGRGAAMRGEASPQYTARHLWDGVADRIVEVLPKAKLVYLMRDPLDRMRSHYLHNVAHGEERAPIDQALESDPVYVDTSRYAWQLEPYLERFDRDQLLLLTTEHLQRHPAGAVRDVFEFLGVDADFVPGNLGRREHVTATKRARRPVIAELRKRPGYRRLAGMAPQWMKRIGYAASTSELSTEGVEISGEAAARLRERLAPDVAALRPLMPADFDGWGLA